MSKYVWKISEERAAQVKKEIVKNVFYYTIENTSSVRGDNKTIHLHILLKDYKISNIASYSINTASYRGDTAIASKMISDIFNYKMKDGYNLLSKKIKVYSI